MRKGRPFLLQALDKRWVLLAVLLFLSLLKIQYHFAASITTFVVGDMIYNEGTNQVSNQSCYIGGGMVL